MVQKLTPNQVRHIEEIQQFMRTVDHVKKLVAELESNRAARPVIINNICGAIARELSQMRHDNLFSEELLRSNEFELDLEEARFRRTGKARGGAAGRSPSPIDSVAAWAVA